ncbi:TRAP-T family transporter, DctQ (4 TMs) subunit [Pseudooceanicola batsensis HTCC2597]|uniref:TRAP transporter small permease protein n=1 Tax=Pseudooceanicola batsensis (strain ATCC BAA-863 / DSM 15984 / KCTC 12145 / HTCC2597) TaxID=252305 RepID=A3TZS4_PSEBH|nr:TRAP transporter small permease [Pseudooceanicola batsensis]EAQ02555.1 TRAP-T family transporter, DctQ (4 TMs) subunit [Pseudooceanicola batsensis HTCC2597]
METVIERLGWVSRIVTYVATALAALMMVHVTIDVVLSQFVAEPLPGTVDYVSYYYMVGLVFLPLSFVEYTNEHIKVDLIHDLLPTGARTVLDMLALALSAAFYGLLTWQTWIDAVEKYTIGEKSMGMAAVTVWPGRFFLPIGAGLIVLLLVTKLIQRPFTDASMTSPERDMYE